VFIGRLNPAAREKDVERFFKGYGRIRDIDLKRGFGFVVSILERGGGGERL
jgi:arginine/serine-rich splicing factor 4/5/6